jgi:transposase
MSARRKHVVIAIEQKLEAVRRIKNGEILRNVAADFGVGISTVSDWVKSKSKLEEHSSKMPNGGPLQTKKL